MSRQSIQQHFERRLGELEAALAVAKDDRDNDEIRVLLREALGSLYAIEEKFKSDMGRAAYFSARGADPDGRTVGGLIWARNLAVHQDAEFHRILMRPIEEVDLPGLPSIPLDRIRIQDFSGEFFTPPSAQIATGSEYEDWPTRKALPAPDRSEDHGRDDMYDEHVADRDLLSPLREAAGFFDRLGQNVPDPALTKYKGVYTVVDGYLFVTFPPGHPNAPREADT